MAIVDGLLVTTFLILFVASITVVGSMLVLALLDLVIGKKRASTEKLDGNSKRAHSLDLEEAMSNWRRERSNEDE